MKAAGQWEEPHFEDYFETPPDADNGPSPSPSPPRRRTRQSRSQISYRDDSEEDLDEETFGRAPARRPKFTPSTRPRRMASQNLNFAEIEDDASDPDDFLEFKVRTGTQNRKPRVTASSNEPTNQSSVRGRARRAPNRFGSQVESPRHRRTRHSYPTRLQRAAFDTPTEAVPLLPVRSRRAPRNQVSGPQSSGESDSVDYSFEDQSLFEEQEEEQEEESKDEPSPPRSPPLKPTARRGPPSSLRNFAGVESTVVAHPPTLEPLLPDEPIISSQPARRANVSERTRRSLPTRSELPAVSERPRRSSRQHTPLPDPGPSSDEFSDSPKLSRKRGRNTEQPRRSKRARRTTSFASDFVDEEDSD